MSYWISSEIYGELLLLTTYEICHLALYCGLGFLAFAFLIDWVTSRPTDEAPRDITEDQEK